jgi:hypothetical protein
MVSLAFWLLTVAVLIGGWLTVRYLSSQHLAERSFGIGHGFFGVAGLAALLVALAHGARGGDRYGLAIFVPVAAGLAALAALVGIVIALRGRRLHRNVEILIGLHAMLAVTAYVMLLAFYSLV